MCPTISSHGNGTAYGTSSVSVVAASTFGSQSLLSTLKSIMLGTVQRAGPVGLVMSASGLMTKNTVSPEWMVDAGIWSCSGTPLWKHFALCDGHDTPCSASIYDETPTAGLRAPPG